MASTLSNLISDAIADLDAAYALNPEGDLEAMKAAALSARLPSSEDKTEWLRLAEFQPDDLIVENVAVYGEIYSKASTMMQDALDAEGEILENQ